MANKKEVHYFDNEKYLANRNPNDAKHYAFFSPNKMHKILE
jgi:hypothetical protein